MTLEQFLSTLASPKVFVTIKEKDGTVVSEIKAITYASLDDTLEAREIEKWEVVSNTNLSIILKEV